MKRASGFAAPCLASILLLTLALPFPQISRAQTTAPVQPPGSVLNAGVVYGLPTCTLDSGATPPETARWAWEPAKPPAVSSEIPKTA